MLNVHFGMEGIFTFVKGKMDSEGNPVTSENITEFPNMILDTGLHRIGENRDWMDWLHLGSGTMLPHPLQAALQSRTYVGKSYIPYPHTSKGFDNTDSERPYSWLRRVFRVPPQGVSKTYSEVGVGWDDINLFSRSLIKNLQGLPTTISILGDEYLDITYEVRLYIPIDTSIYTVTPSGDDLEPREIVVRAAHANALTTSLSWGLAYREVNNVTPVSIIGNVPTGVYPDQSNEIYNGEIGGIYQGPQGSRIGSAFNATDVERLTDTSAAITITRQLEENIGVIRSLVVSRAAFCFQIQMSPPFHKTIEDRFSITYEVSWGRVE